MPSLIYTCIKLISTGKYSDVIIILSKEVWESHSWTDDVKHTINGIILWVSDNLCCFNKWGARHPCPENAPVPSFPPSSSFLPLFFLWWLLTAQLAKWITALFYLTNSYCYLRYSGCCFLLLLFVIFSNILLCFVVIYRYAVTCL